MDEDINIKPTGAVERKLIKNGFKCMKKTATYIEEIKLLSSLFLFLAEAGRLMARYCVAFDTMKQFNKVAGTENLSDLVSSLIRLHGMNVYD